MIECNSFLRFSWITEFRVITLVYWLSFFSVFNTHTHTQKQCLRFWNLTIFLVILFWLEIETINWVIMDNTRKHHCQLKKLLFYSEEFAPISSVNRKKSYFLHSTSINSPFFLPFVRRFFFSVIHTVFDLKNGSKYPDIWQNEVTS